MSELGPLQPFDEHNQRLQSSVCPTDWRNPVPRDSYHLVVIGAGTAGLVTAAGAAGLGARVALIERELMGGDCLNVGCVPSKSLVHSARVVAATRNTEALGVRVPGEPVVDFGCIMERMRKRRADISPNDSAKRFSELGVDVFLGKGRFVDGETIEVEQQDGSTVDLKFKKAVIATGARAAAPPIPGLDSVPYLTNESLFSLTELPKRLGVIGAGPIGAEMAQAFARFGSQVSLFETETQVLSREDPDAAALVAQQMEQDGVQLITESRDQQISPTENAAIRIQGTRADVPYDIEVDQLLVAVGRAPNVEGLNLEQVEVTYDRHGVHVDDHLRTANKRIFAAGDVCSEYKFTHAADFMARIVIQNALFALGPFGRKKVSELVVPWAIYTSPEIAHVGLDEYDANVAGISIDTYIQRFDEVDRAILEDAVGFVKVHVKRGTDQILGATVVADHAGDLISELTLAMTHNLGLSKIGATIHPYPTLSDAIRKLGDQFNRTRLTLVNKTLLRLLLKRHA